MTSQQNKREILTQRFFLRAKKAVEEDVARQVFLGNLNPKTDWMPVLFSCETEWQRLDPLAGEDASDGIFQEGSIDWESVEQAPQSLARYPEVPRPETGLTVAHNGPTDTLGLAEVQVLCANNAGNVEGATAALTEAETPRETLARIGGIVAACVGRVAKMGGTLDGALRAYLMESAFEVRHSSPPPTQEPSK